MANYFRLLWNIADLWVEAANKEQRIPNSDL